ncbi:MAG: Fe-S oxidoreductase [Sphingomonadaceae bacterium]|nr:Fe-S oxidoreductase [Sphingomonadaceae bacterium]
MKSIMLAGVAMLSFAAMPGASLAQQMPASQAPGDAMAPPPDPATPATPSDPGMAAPQPPSEPMPPAPPPPGADPNAGQPTGAVPADPGMVPAPAGVPKDPAAPVGSSANPVTVGGNATPPPAEAKDYPVCSKTVQDSCINRSEARKGRRR